MTLLEAYDHLASEIAARVDLPVVDNLKLRQPALPCIAVVPDASRLSVYGGGSMLSGEHIFSVWIFQPLSGSYRDARSALYAVLQQLSDIPRFFAEPDVEYGEDLVGMNPKTECVLAKIVGKVA